MILARPSWARRPAQPEPRPIVRVRRVRSLIVGRPLLEVDLDRIELVGQHTRLVLPVVVELAHRDECHADRLALVLGRLPASSSPALHRFELGVDGRDRRIIRRGSQHAARERARLSQHAVEVGARVDFAVDARHAPLAPVVIWMTNWVDIHPRRELIAELELCQRRRSRPSPAPAPRRRPRPRRLPSTSPARLTHPPLDVLDVFPARHACLLTDHPPGAQRFGLPLGVW